MLGLNSSVERLFGSSRFAMAYLLTGLGASAVSMISHNVVSAGASGAAFGMIGLLLCAMYRNLGSCGPGFPYPVARDDCSVIVLCPRIMEFNLPIVRAAYNATRVGGCFVRLRQLILGLSLYDPFY